MFDSLLGSNKHAIKCIKARLDPIKKKKQAMVRFLKKDVADLVADGHRDVAFGRLQCLRKQRDCPPEALEAVATLIFAAARFPDLPELCDLRHVFNERYGSHMESFVNQEFIEKVQKKSFSTEKKSEVMQNIAQESLTKFDSKAFERKSSNQPESKYDLPKRCATFSCRNEASPMAPSRHKEDTSSEGIRRPTPADFVQKQEVRIELKDIHVISDVKISHLQEKSRRPIVAEPENIEPDYTSYTPLSHINLQNNHKENPREDYRTNYTVPSIITPRNYLKETRRADSLKEKIIRPPQVGEGFAPCGAEEESGSVKYAGYKISKMVPPYTKPNGTKKEGDVEKESDKSVAKDELRGAQDDPCWNRRAKTQEMDRVSKVDSASSLNQRTINMVPPYTNQQRTMSEKYVEEENDKPLYDGSPNMSPIRPANYAKVADKIPPYVKSKFTTQPMDIINQTAPKITALWREQNFIRTEGAATYDEKIASRTPRNRRRHASRRSSSTYNDYCGEQVQPDKMDNAFDYGEISHRVLSVQRSHTSRRHSVTYDDGYDAGVVERNPRKVVSEMVDATVYGKFTNQTPRGQRSHTSRRHCVTYDNGHDANAADMQLEKVVSEIVGATHDYDKFSTRTPRGQRRHTSRRHKASYDGQYDEEVVDRYPQPVFDETDYAVDYGKLSSQTPGGRRRHGRRGASAFDDNREDEERVVDKLLLHYSRKGLAGEPVKMRTRIEPTDSTYLPERVASFPAAGINGRDRCTPRRLDSFSSPSGQLQPNSKEYVVDIQSRHGFHELDKNVFFRAIAVAGAVDHIVANQPLQRAVPREGAAVIQNCRRRGRRPARQ
ncbi:hypothetical protein ACMD2_10270 [Ananas comosus]|uniref:IST1-like protein n=1 Tax=Ananas comosus TaxID=4615 RepID=A0A199V2G2_ANACO|nr:hypothetical protein ACMD2_10270 [Ananas comosus]